MIRAICPHCSREGQAPDRHAGQQVTCRQCKQLFLLPRTLAALPVASSPVSVHVHEQDNDTDSRSPSSIAIAAWIFVFLASLVVCCGIAYASYLTFTMPLLEGSLAQQYRPFLIFVIAAVALIPAYTLARAIDRLSQ